MNTFTAKTFTIPELTGISKKNIEEHIKLYEGYVNQTNMVLEKIKELSADAEKNIGILSGLQKRLGFEYNGMRNHEVYFESFEGGPKALAEESALRQALGQDFGSFDAWLAYFKAIATTRGVGWAMLYYDKQQNQLLTAWIDEQHLGQLQDCTLVLALDMWEHSFVADYQPSGKKQYIEDFFKNVNWSRVEKNLKKQQNSNIKKAHPCGALFKITNDLKERLYIFHCICHVLVCRCDTLLHRVHRKK